MNVTEAEAVTKWCPLTRVAFLGNTVANRVSSARLQIAKSEADRTGDDCDYKHFAREMADTHCIGSLCMFWKFTGYRPVPSGNDEAHGTCGAAPQFPPEGRELLAT